MPSEQHAHIIIRVIDAVMSHRDLPQFVRSVSAVIKEFFPQVDDFGIARYEAAQHRFSIVATSADDGTNNLGVKTRDDENTPGGFLLKRGRTTMINDLDAFAAQAGVDFRHQFPRPFESGIGALLEHGGEVLGYIYITSVKKNSFTEEHREFLDSIRGIFALAFANVLAYCELSRLKEQAVLEGRYLREEIQENWPADGLIGKSAPWKELMRQINQVAPTDSTVLIQGETGTGKELIARAIHERSRRALKPLIKVNCGALPENLIESELFGHERGAFTGALGKRIGRFELAHEGTIFLDEIGEMPLNLQVKLLRVLQEREFERVGGEKPIRVNVRLITATNKNLAEEVDRGNFRSDLFYRLNVFPVHVPPLRDRPEDAVELARYFVHRYAERMGRGAMRLSEGSEEAVVRYPWPGNVRELEHLVERAIILSHNAEADLRSLLEPTGAPVARPRATPAEYRPPVQAATLIAEAPEGVSLKQSVQEAERLAIEQALREANGVVGGKHGAAARLGMKRQTLQSKMKKLGITLGSPVRSVDLEE